MTKVEMIVEAFESLIEDDSISKSLKEKIEELKDEIDSSKKLSLTVNKAISELEEVCEDVNLQPYIKTQLWGILSILSTMEAEE